MKLELQTERLLLTPLEADDVDIALEMYTDAEVLKYACGVMTEPEIREYMPDAIKRGGNGGIGAWCVAERKTGEKLGEAYLLPMPTNESETDFNQVVLGQMPDADIEVGYFLKRSAWGNGYGTEVCRCMLRFAFEQVLLDEVVASVHEENLASKNVLEKCGLRDFGRAMCYGKISRIYRITRSEWDAKKRSADIELPGPGSASVSKRVMQ